MNTATKIYFVEGLLDGEDGGMLIEDILEEIATDNPNWLETTVNASLGECIQNGEHIRLYVYIFENADYTILCHKYEQVDVADGGTCYQGRVEIFKKDQYPHGVTEEANYYDENGL